MDTAKLLRQVFFMMIKMKIHVLDVDVCLAHTGTKQASKIYVDHVCSKGRAELRFVATVTTSDRVKFCASCVNFPGTLRDFLHNLRRTTSSPSVILH